MRFSMQLASTRRGESWAVALMLRFKPRHKREPSRRVRDMGDTVGSRPAPLKAAGARLHVRLSPTRGAGEPRGELLGLRSPPPMHHHRMPLHDEARTI